MNEAEFRKEILPLKDIMYGMAMRMGLRPEDAADVVQDTIIRLWRGSGNLPPDRVELKLYCLRAFRNTAVTFLGRSRPQRPLEEAVTAKAPPEMDTEYSDTRNRIEILIDTLSPAQREVIRLSSFGDMDNAEIAEATGQSEANVRQLLCRGRKRLRELIQNKFN